jgi:predicted PurR-regulated permease PerM
MKPSKINAWLDATLNELFNNMIGSAGEALSKINSFLIMVVLFPVYLFMILYYRTLLIEFILKLFNSTHHVAVFDVLLSSKMIIQTYLFGLFVEAILIAILNSAGLLIIGIDYAIILGITGAILNVIPYIGGVIAISLPIVVALITKETSSAAFLVIIVYLVIQFIDNNIIVPNIVASRVRINALVSVIVVLAGGALWGVPGMFLSIPLTAILKVICDHITPLKPWGFLLGNIVPTTSRYNFDITRRSRRKVV